MPPVGEKLLRMNEFDAELKRIEEGLDDELAGHAAGKPWINAERDYRRLQTKILLEIYRLA